MKHKLLVFKTKMRLIWKLLHANVIMTTMDETDKNYTYEVDFSIDKK